MVAVQLHSEELFAIILLMRQIIINADDFGMSREVNEGIKKGIKAGTINSVSVMANMPYYNDVISFLKKHPRLAVGLHFNVTEGQSILPPKEVSTILREDNNFYHWHSLVPKLITKKCSLKQIEQELRAQYNKLAKSGLCITHIDSHHHIHLYPSINELIVQLANEKKVPSLRSRRFNLWGAAYGYQHRLTLKQLFIQALYYFNAAFSKKDSGNGKSFLEVSGIFDANWDANFNDSVLEKILLGIPDGITEIICHPAVMSETGNPEFLRPRQQVLSALLNKSIKEILEKNNIQFYNRN